MSGLLYLRFAGMGAGRLLGHFVGSLLRLQNSQRYKPRQTADHLQSGAFALCLWLALSGPITDVYPVQFVERPCRHPVSEVGGEFGYASRPDIQFPLCLRVEKEYMNLMLLAAMVATVFRAAPRDGAWAVIRRFLDPFSRIYY